nr:hypothetical protein L204_00885 [Cryptococcus depauperatus CBS 7855]
MGGIGEIVIFGGILLHLSAQRKVLRTIWLAINILDTFRALRMVSTNGRRIGAGTRRKAMRDSLACWFIYVLGTMISPSLTFLLGWLPLYSPVKTVICLSFLSTRLASSLAILTYFKPLIRPYETSIDICLHLFEAITMLLFYFGVQVPFYSVIESLKAAKSLMVEINGKLRDSLRRSWIRIQSRLGAINENTLPNSSCSPHSHVTPQTQIQNSCSNYKNDSQSPKPRRPIQPVITLLHSSHSEPASPKSLISSNTQIRKRRCTPNIDEKSNFLAPAPEMPIRRYPRRDKSTESLHVNKINLIIPTEQPSSPDVQIRGDKDVERGDKRTDDSLYSFEFKKMEKLKDSRKKQKDQLSTSVGDNLEESRIFKIGKRQETVNKSKRENGGFANSTSKKRKQDEITSKARPTSRLAHAIGANDRENNISTLVPLSSAALVTTKSSKNFSSSDSQNLKFEPRLSVSSKNASTLFRLSPQPQSRSAPPQHSVQLNTNTYPIKPAPNSKIHPRQSSLTSRTRPPRATRALSNHGAPSKQLLISATSHARVAQTRARVKSSVQKDPEKERKERQVGNKVIGKRSATTAEDIPEGKERSKRARMK